MKTKKIWNLDKKLLTGGFVPHLKILENLMAFCWVMFNHGRSAKFYSIIWACPHEEPC